ncbi:hypothetical protein K505DRAFT_366377 [Melanomma pulvis-pyrius CBS 109.77]|uniref:Ferritin-like domain-containing protein n=1 Tax=Melanomma pulvis-pyrius CBS 109.77 TaxID=1314802 RepID=A0A6A6WXE3_9PLEO|nr:hypothetical protein K505DRAFT_366377 [Melanomma pulvis-pyrius CBS 109.77]
MKFSTASSIVLATASTCLAHPTRRAEEAAAPKITDVDILQYALTLEHLEDKFYREGLANFTLKHFEEAGFNETFYNNLKEVSYDETTHVSFLTTALKGVNATPVAECTYAFGVTDVKTFIATAAILEGVGVSAYLGAAASIVEKAYLTAAASILTVESRHSSYLRAAQKQSPFPQPFDAPLDLNEVFTLAGQFIVSCPATNGALPVKAFPLLTLDPAFMNVTTNSSVAFETKAVIAEADKAGPWYAAWVSVTGPVYTPATYVDCKFHTTVPVGYHGQNYVVISKKEGCMTDDCVTAGPAIVEVTGKNVEEYQEDIRKAISTAFNPHPTAFTKVSVLLMHWENDDLDVALLEQELGKVFEEIYGFDVEYYEIKATPTASIDF